ncbi:MAG: N-acetyl-gamma-glutamyl-phosphate reductase [Phycisphaera sp.]|nr:N-acetyl-gamma-glutamyl-phosphate reductase [Phycisphaera sp.]
MTIRAAIVGPTGYTGYHLIKLLAQHPGADLAYLASHRDALPNMAEVFPSLLGRLPERKLQCRPIDPKAIAREADVVFLGLPHRAAMAYVPGLLDAGLTVIDLSADYRLASAELYHKVYDHPHEDPGNLDHAIYGLPELFRKYIPGAKLIANPGCYPTTAAIAIAPLLHAQLIKTSPILINAASGVTGAGKTPAPHLHFPEQNEAYGAYGKIGGHRHQPEIEQTLRTVMGSIQDAAQPPTPEALSVLFVPHLLPIDQGILETIYLQPTQEDITEEAVFDAFEEAYDDEPFVRVRTELPNVKHVRDTNFCDVTARVVTTGNTKTIVVFAALDNMVKGASGQAIQNMNLVFGLDETTGLL